MDRYAANKEVQGAAVRPKGPEIMELIERLTKAEMACDDRLALLRERLSRVLRPTAEAVSEANRLRPAAATQLGEELQGLVTAAESRHAALEDILSRLEL